MTAGSLFSGIGGLDLGLEWAGMTPAWFCEIEPYPQQVLTRRWPGVPIINDIRDVTAESVQRVDVIAGGFPCQDISYAGKGRGIDYDLALGEGTRSGLWWEMWRVIRDLGPRYVIAENVAALAGRGLDIVLGSLAEIGYDAEWTTVSAASVGAPHIRERVFIVAYPNNPGLEGRCGGGERGGQRRAGEGGTYADGEMEHPNRERREPLGGRDESGQQGLPDGGCDEDVSDARSGRQQGPGGHEYARDTEEGATREATEPVYDRGPDESHGLSGHSWFGGEWAQPWPVSFRAVEHAAGVGRGEGRSEPAVRGGGHAPSIAGSAGGADVADAERDEPERGGGSGDVGGTAGAGEGGEEERERVRDAPRSGRPPEWERVAPVGDVRGVADGIPLRLDEDGWLYTDVPDRTARLKALGNAVVPQVAYLIGRAVMEHAAEMEHAAQRAA